MDPQTGKVSCNNWNATYTIPGSAFPAWKGSLFVGGLGGTALVRLVVDGEKVVGEERLQLLLLRRDRGLISARRREPQCDQLEHRLEIFLRARAAESFFQFADQRARGRDLAGQELA